MRYRHLATALAFWMTLVVAAVTIAPSASHGAPPPSSPSSTQLGSPPDGR